MATQEEVRIGISAQINDLRRTMAQIPGITEGEMKRMAIAMERQWRRSEQAAKAMTTAVSRASREASREAERASAEALGSVSRASDKLTGGILGDLGDLAEGFAGIRAGGLAAAAPVLALGGAILGLQAGQAILSLEAQLIAGVATGLAQATLGAKDYLEEAKKFESIPDLQLGLDQEQIDSLDAAAAAVDALQKLAAKASAEIGTGFAPTLQAVATVAVAAGLAFDDLLKSVGRGIAAFAEWRAGLEPWQRQLLDAAAPVAGLIAGAEDLNARLASGTTMLGDYGKRASELVGQLVALKRGEEDAAKGAKSVADAQREAAEALREYNEMVRGRETLISLQLKALDDVLSAEEKLENAYLESAKAAEQAAQAAGDAALLEQTLGEIQLRYQRDLNAVRQEAAASERANLAANAEAAEAALQRRRTAEEELASYLKRQREEEAAQLAGVAQIAVRTVGAAADLYAQHHQERLEQIRAEREAARDAEGNLTEAARAGFRARAQEEKRALRRAFAAQQAGALAAAAIDAARSAVALIPAYAFLGPAAPAAAAATAGAALAVQTATILAQKPPKFHTGGEVDARLLDGEHVVRQGPAERYRPELDRLNETGEWPAPPGRASTQVFLDGRLAAEIVDAGWSHSRSAGRTRPGVRKPGMGNGYNRER